MNNLYRWLWTVVTVAFLWSSAECVMNGYRNAHRRDGPPNWGPPSFVRPRKPPPSPFLGRIMGPPPSHVKRVYVPMYPGPNPPMRNYPVMNQQRFSSNSLPPKRSPPPPPGRRTRIPYQNFVQNPPRKWRPQKPNKFAKPYRKHSSLKYDVYGKPLVPNAVQTDQHGAPKKQVKVPTTTYGIPHPTLGSPEPPKEEPTSYVHFQQNDREVDSKTSYTFTNTHATNTHKGKVYDETNHSPVYKHNDTSSETESSTKTSGFQPPKQTYGFQPFEDHSFFSVTTQQQVAQPSQKPDDYLSPNYYDQKH